MSTALTVRVDELKFGDMLHTYVGSSDRYLPGILARPGETTSGHLLKVYYTSTTDAGTHFEWSYLEASGDKNLGFVELPSDYLVNVERPEVES